MSAPYLIALDLDGTLFDEAKRVSTRAKAALAALVERGHHVVAVTGRSRFSALALLADVPAIERVVGSNGAYEHRVAGGELAWSRPIAPDEGERWVRLARERFAGASVGWECESGIVYEPRFLALVDDPRTIDPGEPGEAPHAGPLHKLYVRAPALAGRELQRALGEALGEAAEVSTSGVPFVEATAAGVDKGSGLERVAASLGVPLARCIAFGDNLNDVPMFRRAGHAVAMGNAVDEVRALAGRCAPRNVEDGVAVVLERFLEHGLPGAS